MLSVGKQWMLLAILLCGVMAVYYLFDPMESSWMPQCVFHRLTGLKCMGCGSQRMLHALLHGEIGEAVRANMFVAFSLPVIVFLLFVEVNRKRYKGLYKKVHSVPVIITGAAMLGAWLFVRNILGI